LSKKVVITGGMGDIAIALTDKLVSNGYTVLNPGRNELDVTSYLSVSNFFKINHMDILINNAGYINPSSFVECDKLDWDKHFSVNVAGAFVCSKHAVRNGCSCIVNIGSSAGINGKKDWSAYCCSKRALSALTECISLEGISCISISPGRTDTKMRSMLYPGEDKTNLLTTSEFACAFFDIFSDFKKFNGMDIVVKKEYGLVEKFYFKGLKIYV